MAGLKFWNRRPKQKIHINPNVPSEPESAGCFTGTPHCFPPAGVISYIPYRTGMDDVQGWTYGRRPWIRKIALARLLNTGNCPPPERTFADASAFLNFIRSSRNFRNACVLTDACFLLDGHERPCGFSFNYEGILGYTLLTRGALIPLRVHDAKVSCFGHARKCPKFIGDGHTGVGGTRPVPIDTTTFSRFRLHSNYRLNWWWDALQVPLSRHRAPKLWTTIDCAIDGQKKLTMVVKSSHIPSQAVYIYWAIAECHDMLKTSKDEVEQTITVGRKEPPGRDVYTWPEAGSGGE